MDATPALPIWAGFPASVPPLLGFCLLVLTLFVLLSGQKKFGNATKLLRLPPGPRALPIIGHLHLLSGSLPHQAFARLSKLYGPLMFIRLGSVPVLVASSPDMAMAILQTHDKIFSSRPQNLSAPNTIFGCAPGILYSQPGPYWRLLRQICVTDFFSNKRLEYFRPVRNDEVGCLMLHILSSAYKPIDVLEVVQATNNNVISSMTLGKRLRDLAPGVGDSIVSTIVEIVCLLGVFNLSDYFPSLAWLDLQGYGKRSKDVARKAQSAFQEVIDKRRSIRSPDCEPQDLLDLLLIAAVDTKNKEHEMKDINIRTMLIDMFAGGTDTAAVATEWALAELLANPDKMKKAKWELDRVVGKERLVQESDLLNMPYLRAIVMETMRIHPVGPLLGPHAAMKTTKVDEYHIAANTMVYINVWAIHRDPNVWDNPLEFRPERFLDNEVDVVGQQFKYLPFGSGRRACPAWKMGMLSVQVVLANLLHAFDWSVAEKLDMSEKFGMAVSKAKPLMATPTPRLSLHLYEGYRDGDRRP